jgi:hypothetical protein
MGTTEIIKQGLESSKDEGEFREWAASQGILECVEKDADDERLFGYSLADLAFRAREMVLGNDPSWDILIMWGKAKEAVWDQVRTRWEEEQRMGPKPHDKCLGPNPEDSFFADFASDYHWVMAGCIALEMKKEGK